MIMSRSSATRNRFLLRGKRTYCRHYLVGLYLWFDMGDWLLHHQKRSGPSGDDLAQRNMASNKGKNTTGLLGATAATPDTVPQVYKDAIAIPGTLEAENYDVGGQNQSYYDEDATNQGDTTLPAMTAWTL